MCIRDSQGPRPTLFFLSPRPKFRPNQTSGEHVSDPDEYVGTLVQRHFPNPQSFFGTDQDFFQSPAPNSEGKFLTLIALVERGREMPFPIRLLTENLAQRNLLSFPPGLRVERGNFSGNNARDFSKVGF